MLTRIKKHLGAIVCAIAVLVILCVSSLLIGWAAGARSVSTRTSQHHAVTFTGHLTIPSIQVNAPIETVGLTKEGAMDVPSEPDRIGFFSLGPRLGEEGTVVLAGHYGWKDGKPAAFDNLHSLQVGDTFSVLDAHGKRFSFRVRKTVSYDKDAIVPEVFTSESGSHLNLIACEGTWDKNSKTYSGRQVVFSDRIP